MIIKTLVIEDEPRARKNLISLLEENFPNIKVIGETGSVIDTIAWLKENEADAVFMDVELSDGNCFDIFRHIEVKGQIVMTTAYDNYAVKAFEVNSVDYLLKPIEIEDLRRAVGRIEKNLSMVNTPIESIDFKKVMEAFKPSGGLYKDRFIIRINDRIVPVNVRDIAYIYSEAKNSYIVTSDDTSYVLDESLDTVETTLDPNRFFRISRSCIIAEESIESISKLLGGRLRISLKKGISCSTEMTVSRARVPLFMSWLEK